MDVHTVAEHLRKLSGGSDAVRPKTILDNYPIGKTGLRRKAQIVGAKIHGKTRGAYYFVDEIARALVLED